MKKFCLGLIVVSLMLPAWAMAGGYASPSSDQLLQRLDQLTRELENVKQELNRVKAEQGQLAEAQEDLADTVDENAEGIDEINTNGVNRFQVFGDYRFRLDSTRLNTNGFTGFDPNTMTPYDVRGERVTNDTLYTNRLRLGMKVKATDNITFKGRLTMYKIWGMETANKTNSGLFPMNGFSYDPNMSRRPNDNTLRVEMAYVNWVNIFDLPMWISVGRRPLLTDLLHSFATTMTAATLLQLLLGLTGRLTAPLSAGQAMNSIFRAQRFVSATDEAMRRDLTTPVMVQATLLIPTSMDFPGISLMTRKPTGLPTCSSSVPRVFPT